MDHHLLTRRRIVQRFLVGTASYLTGTGLCKQVLAASLPSIPTVGSLLLNLDEFPSLQEEGGSVQLEVGLAKPIIVNRAANGFHVLSSRCQHSGCTVNTFDPELGAMPCPCHGSLFGLDGALIQGPATRGLDRYEATLIANKLSIRLPGVTFAAREIAMVQTATGAARVRLSFQATLLSSYEVQHRTSLTPGATSQTVPFSLTLNGAATQTFYKNTVFNANDPLPLVHVFVDVSGPRGFFCIVRLP